MLIAEALDERDFLRKKILEKIKKLKAATVVKTSDKTVDDGRTIEQFNEDAVTAVQSIRDQIKRYKAINLAIANSNSTETVTVGGRTMTRAEAITIRKDHAMQADLEDMLNRKLFESIGDAQVIYSRSKSAYEKSRERYIQTLLNSEGAKELSEDKLLAVDSITKGDIPVLLDPVKLIDKVDTFVEEQERFYKELETAIKVSNASTFIELD